MMSIIKPFKGIRPKKEWAQKVASPPYDVLNSDEARAIAEKNPYSFLHVNKPEVDLSPEIDLYDEKVYQKGSENFNRLQKDEILISDEKPNFYVYRQIMGEHKQYGLVAAASVDEYDKDIIKKHELTRTDKENDRVKHILSLGAQVGPVFLTYKAQPAIDTIVENIVKNEAEYDFTSDDGIKHTFWVVSDEETIKELQKQFSGIDYLYVADGHHRSAAASRVQKELMKKNSNHKGDEEYNFFLTVIFPHNQMNILDYNRVVKDLNGLSNSEFMDTISKNFTIAEINGTVKPQKAHDFSMYLDKKWYNLSAKSSIINEADPVGRLDVSILQENLLAPVLGIGDPRTDKRIDFVGGIRGMKELEQRVDSEEMKIAFALFPTSIEELMAIADAGLIMPPKSTWFEPKLRSGLINHSLK
jgi:uncharacterized protein (DUF1015 family)